MKHRLMEILACPIDRFYPLELHVFVEEGEGVVEGMIVCPKCNRFYPIKEEIPEMLPDELRDLKEDLEFLRRWRERVPEKVLKEGKPVNLSGELKEGKG